MAEETELTQIERELVLQYLRDDNVPLTVTLEDKPEMSDADIVDDKTIGTSDESRVPASAIFPVAVRMVYQVANAVNIPVVGMGGVTTAEDVVELLDAVVALAGRHFAEPATQQTALCRAVRRLVVMVSDSHFSFLTIFRFFSLVF